MIDPSRVPCSSQVCPDHYETMAGQPGMPSVVSLGKKKYVLSLVSTYLNQTSAVESAFLSERSNPGPRMRGWSWVTRAVSLWHELTEIFSISDVI